MAVSNQQGHLPSNPRSEQFLCLSHTLVSRTFTAQSRSAAVPIIAARICAGCERGPVDHSLP